jgi:AraC-like DNA-binding protein
MLASLNVDHYATLDLRESHAISLAPAPTRSTSPIAPWEHRDFNIQVIEENTDSLTIILRRPDGDNLELTALLEAIGIELTRTAIARDSSRTDASPTSGSIFPNHPQLTNVFQFIEQNYQEPINLEDVAQAVGYSPAYLTDLVRRQTGKSVCRWITERRMVETCRLLRQTEHTVESIAEIVGYRNLGSFFRQFRQRFGETPQAWRNAQSA